MSSRAALLEALVDELREAQLALEVAEYVGNAAEQAAAEATLVRLRERHALLSACVGRS